jgi:hypothetical protein
MARESTARPGEAGMRCVNYQTPSPIPFEIPRESKHGEPKVGKKIGVDEHLEWNYS